METEIFYDAQKPDTEDEDEDKVNLLSSKKSNTKIQRSSQQSSYLSKIKELSLNKEFLVLKEKKDVYQISISANTCGTCEKALQKKAGKCGTCFKARSVGIQVVVSKTKPPLAVCDCIPCDCDPGSLCKDTISLKPRKEAKSLPKKPCPAYEYLRNNSESKPKSPCRANQYVDEEYAALQEAKLNALLQVATDLARPKPVKVLVNCICTDTQTDNKDIQIDKEKEKVCTTCVCAGDDKSTICTKTGEICPKAKFSKVCTAVCASDKETMCLMTGKVCSSAAKVCPSVCSTDTSIVCPKTGVCKNAESETPTQEIGKSLTKEKESKQTIEDADTKKKENPCWELDRIRELKKAEAQKEKELRSLKTTEAAVEVGVPNKEISTEKPASRENEENNCKEIPTVVQKASATIKPCSGEKEILTVVQKASATIKPASREEEIPTVVQKASATIKAASREKDIATVVQKASATIKPASSVDKAKPVESKSINVTQSVTVKPSATVRADKLMETKPSTTLSSAVDSEVVLQNFVCDADCEVCPYRKKDGICSGICSTTENQICRKTNDVCPRKISFEDKPQNSADTICKSVCSKGKQDCRLTEGVCPNKDSTSLQIADGVCPGTCSKSDQICEKNKDVCPRKSQDTFSGFVCDADCACSDGICPNTQTVCPYKPKTENDDNVECVCASSIKESETSIGKEKVKEPKKELPCWEVERLEELKQRDALMRKVLRGSKSATAQLGKSGTTATSKKDDTKAKEKQTGKKEPDKPQMVKDEGVVKDVVSELCKGVCSTTDKICQKTQGICPKKIKDEDLVKGVVSELCKGICSTTDKICQKTQGICPKKTSARTGLQKSATSTEKKTKKDLPCWELERLKELRQRKALMKRVLATVQSEKSGSTPTARSSTGTKSAKNISAVKSKEKPTEIIFSRKGTDKPIAKNPKVKSKKNQEEDVVKEVVSELCKGVCSTTDKPCQKTQGICPSKSSTGDISQGVQEALNKLVCKAVCSTDKDICKLTGAICPNKDETGLDSQGKVCPSICSTTGDICPNTGVVCASKSQTEVCTGICSSTGDICPNTGVVCTDDKNQGGVECVCVKGQRRSLTKDDKSKGEKDDLPCWERERLEELRERDALMKRVLGGSKSLAATSITNDTPSSGKDTTSVGKSTRTTRSDDTESPETSKEKKQTEIIVEKEEPDVEKVEVKTETSQSKGDEILPKKVQISKVCPGVCSTTDETCQKAKGICPRKGDTVTSPEVVQETMQNLICKAVCSTGEDICKLTGAVCPNKGTGKGQENIICPATGKVCKDYQKQVGEECICVTSTEESTSENDVEVRALKAKLEKDNEKGGKNEDKDNKSKGKEDDLPCWELERLEELRQREALMKRVLGGSKSLTVTSTTNATPSSSKGTTSVGKSTRSTKRDETKSPESSKERKQTEIIAAKKDPDIKPKATKKTSARRVSLDNVEVKTEKDQISKVCPGVCSTTDETCQKAKGICPRKGDTVTSPEVVQETMQNLICKAVCSTGKDICKLTGAVCPNQGKGQENIICPATGKVCKDNRNQAEEECICVTSAEASTSEKDVKVRALKAKREKDNEKGGKDEDKDGKPKGKEEDLPCWELERLEELRQREALMKRVLGGSKSLTVTSTTNTTPSSSKGTTSVGKSTRTTKRDNTKSPESSKERKQTEIIAGRKDPDINPKATKKNPARRVSLGNVEVKTEKEQISKVCSGVCSTTDETCQKSKGICPRKSGTDTSPGIVQETIQNLICKAVCSTGKDICKLTGAVCPNQGKGQENIICPATGKVCKDNQNQAEEECICVTSTQVRALDTKGGKDNVKRGKGNEKGGKDDEKEEKDELDNLPCWEKERLRELKQREKERLAAGLPIKPSEARPTKKEDKRIYDKSDRGQKTLGKSDKGISAGKSSEKFKEGTKQSPSKGKISGKLSKAAGRGGEGVCPNKRDGVCENVCESICQSKDGGGKEDDGRDVSGSGGGGKGGSGTGGRTRSPDVADTKAGPDCICGGKSNKDGDLICQADCAEAAKNKTSIFDTIKTICEAVCAGGEKSNICPCTPDICKGPCSNSKKEDVNLEICPFTGAVCPSKPETQDQSIICPTTGNVCPRQKKSGESKEVGTNLKGTDICPGTGAICPSKGRGKDVICPGVGGICPINIKGDAKKKEETTKPKGEVCPATGKICTAVGTQVETSKPKAGICPATGKICKAVGTQAETSKPATDKRKPVSTNQAGVQTCPATGKPCLPKTGKMAGINADDTVHPKVEAAGPKELRIGKSQVLCTVCPTKSIGTCPDICPSKQLKAADKSTTFPDGPGGNISGTKTVEKGVICPSTGKICQKDIGTMKTPEVCPAKCVPKANMTEKPVQIQEKPLEIPQKSVERLQVKASKVVEEQKPATVAAIQKPPEYIRPTPRSVQPKEPERKASRPKYDVTCPVTGGVCYTTGIVCPPPGEICPTTGTVCPTKRNAPKAAVAVTEKASEVVTQQKETIEKENVTMEAITVEKTESSIKEKESSAKEKESSAKEKENDAKEEDNSNNVKTSICVKPCICEKRKQKEMKKEEPCICAKRKQKEGYLEKSEGKKDKVQDSSKEKKDGTGQKPTKRTDKSKISDTEEGKGKKATQEAKPCWVLEKEAELAEREKQRKKLGLGSSGSTKVPPKGKSLVSKGMSTTKTGKKTSGDKSQKATTRAISPGATDKGDKADNTDQGGLKTDEVCPKTGDICSRTSGPCPAASGGICRKDKTESSAEEKENDAKEEVDSSNVKTGEVKPCICAERKQKSGDLGKSEGKKGIAQDSSEGKKDGTGQKPTKRADKSKIADSEEDTGKEGTQEAKPCWVLEKEAELAEREKQRKKLGLGSPGVSKGVSTTKSGKKTSGDKSRKAISSGAANKRGKGDKTDQGGLKTGQGELKTDQGELKPDGVCPKTGDIICSRIGGPCPAASGGICKKDKISTSSDVCPETCPESGEICPMAQAICPEAKGGVSSIEPKSQGENVCPATGNVCLNSADQRGSSSNKSLQVCPGTGDICPKTKDVCPSTSGGICKDYGKGVQAGVDQRGICPFTGGICPRKANNSTDICPATGSICTSKNVAFSEKQEKSADQNICPATGTVCEFGNKSKEGIVESTKSASQNICPATGTVCERRNKSKEGIVEGTKSVSQNICPATGTVCERGNQTNKEVAEGTKSASQNYCPATGTVCQFSDKSKGGNDICPSTREICPKTKGVCIGEVCTKKLADAMVGTDTTTVGIDLNKEKKKLPPKKSLCTCMLKIPEDFSVICQPCGNWHKLNKLPTVEEMRMLTPEQLESLCPCNPCNCEVCWNKPAPRQPGEDDYETDTTAGLGGDSCSCGIKSDSCTCGSTKQTDGVGDQDCSCLPSSQTTPASKTGCCCLPNCNCTNCSILAMTKELDLLRKKLFEITNNGESSKKPQTRSVNSKEQTPQINVDTNKKQLGQKDDNTNEKPASSEIECICKGPNTGKEGNGKNTGKDDDKKKNGKRAGWNTTGGKDGEDDENGKKPCWVLEREAELKERAAQRKRLGMGPPITGRSRSSNEENTIRPGSAPNGTSRSAGGSAKSSSGRDINSVNQIDSSARPTTCPEACPDPFNRNDDSDTIQTRAIGIDDGAKNNEGAKNNKKPCWVLEREAELAEREAQKIRLGMISDPNKSRSIGGRKGGTDKRKANKGGTDKGGTDKDGSSGQGELSCGCPIQQ